MTMKPITLLITLFLLSGICTEASPRSVSATGRLSPRADSIIALYHTQLSRNTAFSYGDRVAYLFENTPLDTLVAHYIDRKFATQNDPVSLPGYFTLKRYIFTNEEREDFKQHISNDIRQKYKNKDAQRLFELAEIMHIVGYGDYKMQSFERFLRKVRKWNDPALEAYTLNLMWSESYYSSDFARSFRYARQAEEALGRVESADYPQKSSDYFSLGGAYYKFKDYEEATRLLRKAIASEGNHLRSWNYLAAIHNRNGQIDSAAYYHHTILASRQTWQEDPIHMAIAISNLGRIEMKRGNYDDALAMLQTGLSGFIDRWDIIFRAGIHISLGECYLEKGDTAAVRREINSAQLDIDAIEEEFKPLDLIKNLYALKSRFYQCLGQSHQSKLYQDSVMVMASRYEQETGRHIIILGEQEAEAELKNQKIRSQHHIILFAIVALILITAALLVIVGLYRRRNAAYKKLAQRAQEWAMQEETARMPATITPPLPENGNAPETEAASPDTHTETNGKPNGHPTAEDLRILALADREMAENHAYREAGITLDSIAIRLDIRRNAFSGAINKVTGGNFNQYINGYRIREAVRIISQTERRELYIDELYERVGFTSRSTFSRTFKQFTGLSPLEFQKQKGNGLKNDEI